MITRGYGIKLLTALDDFNDGDYEDAIEHLETFTSHVEAQQGKHIDTDVAQELLDYTADLIEYLSGL